MYFVFPTKTYQKSLFQADLLLVYKIEHGKLVLILADIGTHVGLFG